MNKKTLTIAGIIALAVAILGLAATQKEEGKTQVPEETQALFPGLKDQVNNATKVVLTDGGETLTLVRLDDFWGLEEKGNYPAQIDQVRETVMNIAEMEKVEEKTANPEYFGRLNLQDPSDEGAESSQVTISGDDGTVLGDVILGKQESVQGMASRETRQYVRKAGEQQTWLVDNAARVNLNATRWLDTQIMDIRSNRVAEVTLNSEEEDGKVRAARENPNDQNFELLTRPEGRELKNEYATREFGRLLQGLRFQDVAARDSLELPDEPEATARVTAYNGLTVTAHLYSLDGQQYATFEAGVSEEQIEAENNRRRAEAKAQAADTPDPAEEEPSEEAEPKNEGADLIEPESVRQEAQELNESVSKWAYVLPSFTLERFTRSNDYYLKPLEDEAEAEEAAEPTASPRREPPQVPEIPDDLEQLNMQMPQQPQ